MFIISHNRILKVDQILTLIHFIVILEQTKVDPSVQLTMKRFKLSITFATTLFIRNIPTMVVKMVKMLTQSNNKMKQ